MQRGVRSGEAAAVQGASLGNQQQQSLEREAHQFAAQVGPSAGPAGDDASVANARLSPSTRAFFEPRLGQDLGDVRVHTDSAAQAEARALGAEAFTSGRDIYSAAGQLAPATLAHELAHVAQQQRGAASGVQCRDDEKKPLLINTEKVFTVWSAFVNRQAAAMKLSQDDPRVRAAADAATATQVGPTNFARFAEEYEPAQITLDPVNQAKISAKVEADIAEDEAPKPYLLKNGQPWSSAGAAAELSDEAEGMFADTKDLRTEVARMDHDAIKLKTPEGWEGQLYQYGAGITGMALAPTAGTLSKVVGLPVQKLIAKVRGKKSDASLEKIADEQVSDAVTAYQLTVGDLNQIYEDSRAQYDRFLAATRALDEARTTLRNTDDYPEAAAAYAKAEAAKKEIKAAYIAYASECEMLGIPTKAKNLERTMEDMAEGHTFIMTSVIPIPGASESKAGRALLREAEQAVEELVPAAGKELAKDTGTQVGKEVVKDSGTAGKEALKDSGAAGKEVVKDAKQPIVYEKVPGGLDTPPANDMFPPSDAAAAAVPEEVGLKRAAGDGLVDSAAPAAGDALDPIASAGGKMPAKTAQLLKVKRMANQAGYLVQEAKPTKRDLKAVQAYLAEATPQKGGVAAHDALGMAPKGADVVYLDTVGELKTLTVVSRGALDAAFAQAARYAKQLGKKDILVRVFDMTNGIIYDFIKK
jgi:hypothetical protein